MDSSARTQVPVAGERWRELTLQANAQHAARDFRGALRLYNAAFGEAEAVLGRELRAPDSRRIIGPLLLTISDHNLAQVARVQGKRVQASQHLVVAFERLIGLGLAREVPLCIRASAARSLRPALEELLVDLVRPGHFFRDGSRRARFSQGPRATKEWRPPFRGARGRCGNREQARHRERSDQVVLGLARHESRASGLITRARAVLHVVEEAEKACAH